MANNIAPPRCWASTCSAYIELEGKKLDHSYISLVLDPDVQPYFSGIRLQITQRLHRQHRLEDVIEMRPNHVNRTALGLRSKAKFTQNYRLPLLNVTVDLTMGFGDVSFPDYQAVPHLLLGFPSKPYQPTPNFPRLLHESIHPIHPDVHNFTFMIKWSVSVSESSNVNWDDDPWIPQSHPPRRPPKPYIAIMNLARILPLSPRSRLASLVCSLSSQIITRIADFAIDSSQRSWPSYLLGLSLVHKQWGHLRSTFWERLGRFEPATFINSKLIVRLLKENPEIGQDITCFRLNSFITGIRVREVEERDHLIADFIHQVSSHLKTCFLDSNIFETLLSNTIGALRPLCGIEKLDIDLGKQSVYGVFSGDRNIDELQQLIFSWRRLECLNILHGSRHFPKLEPPAYSLTTLRIKHSHLSGAELHHFVANPTQRLHTAFIFNVKYLRNNDIYDFLSATSSTLTYLTLFPATDQVMEEGEELALDRCIHRMQKLRLLNARSDTFSAKTICRRGIKESTPHPIKTTLKTRLGWGSNTTLGVLLEGMKSTEWDVINLQVFDRDSDGEHRLHLREAARIARERGFVFKISRLAYHDEEPTDLPQE